MSRRRLIITAIMLILAMSLTYAGINCDINVGFEGTTGLGMKAARLGYDKVDGIDPCYFAPQWGWGTKVLFTFPDKSFACRVNFCMQNYLARHTHFTPGEYRTYNYIEPNVYNIDLAFMWLKPFSEDLELLAGGGVKAGTYTVQEDPLINGEGLRWFDLHVPVTAHGNVDVLYRFADNFYLSATASAGITYTFKTPMKDYSTKHDPTDPVLEAQFNQFRKMVEVDPYLPFSFHTELRLGVTYRFPKIW